MKKLKNFFEKLTVLSRDLVEVIKSALRGDKEAIAKAISILLAFAAGVCLLAGIIWLAVKFLPILAGMTLLFFAAFHEQIEAWWLKRRVKRKLYSVRVGERFYGVGGIYPDIFHKRFSEIIALFKTAHLVNVTENADVIRYELDYMLGYEYDLEFVKLCKKIDEKVLVEYINEQGFYNVYTEPLTAVDINPEAVLIYHAKSEEGIKLVTEVKERVRRKLEPRDTPPSALDEEWDG